MKKLLILLAFTLFVTCKVLAQNDSDSVLFPEILLENIDSLTNQSITELSKNKIIYPDSIYSKRLSALNYNFKMDYNPIVKRFIELYTTKIKYKLQIMIGLGDFYFPIFNRILAIYELPQELRYIPIIESALDPRAVSPAHAVGLWQFIRGTGKENGLTINKLVDQRRSIAEASDAAAKYLKNLFQIYGDWQLVLAAYNCGPGNVNKAIRRSGGKRNFWDIYRFLPRETRSYIPEFIGAAYAFNYYKEHNLTPVPMTLPLETDTIVINKELYLEQVSSVLNIPMNLIKNLNPQYLKNFIPSSENIKFAIRVPIDQKSKFKELEDSIYSWKVTSNQNKFKTKGHSNLSIINNSNKIIHKVQIGESIWLISCLYKVTVNNIKDWNKIQGNKIKTGQTIIVYIPTRSTIKRDI